MQHGTRLGFVDYRLENGHANIFLSAYRNKLKDRGVTVTSCWGLDQADGQAWAVKNNVTYCDSVEQMAPLVDGFLILAPSNPEKHLELCEHTFPFAKPTYVDKTFAPDLATAQAIFDLADRYHTPVQSSSALRYTGIQQHVQAKGREKVRHMVAWGGGTSFGEYAVHVVELIVSCMGPRAERLRVRRDGVYSQLLIDFSDHRTAVGNVYIKENTPFAAAITTTEDTRLIQPDLSTMFADTAAGILDFVKDQKEHIDRAETLMIRRVLDAAEDPRALETFIAL